MLSRRKKTWIIVVALALLALSPLLVLAHPRARAALRLTSGFTPLEQDSRVLYEAGAEDDARWIARALPGAVERIEESHGLPFRSDFRVYVCASHESFSRRVSWSSSRASSTPTSSAIASRSAASR